MAFIRNRSEVLTGCQEAHPWSPQIDMQYDFVMVYGTTNDMVGRIRQFKEKGYVVHLMSGSAWGAYQDFLRGEWDGREHWDESQTDRNGEPILHGVETPYLSPSVAFADYLTEKLKPAVDAGVEAIHLEEPEFWDNGGYSEAFKREYKLFYGEDWVAPHTSPEARYRAARLKVYLYKRLVARVSEAIKEYAMSKYGKALKFYIPTHSLVNYTQWKILSPEATLLDIPSVDGYIAQIWTGTSRVGNVYAGKYDERTFETAFLEYGIMQELVRGTGRRMWFLHDPIEDHPEHTWEDFRTNYLKTVAASLLHPDVHHYEVCPWPTRIFDGVYPKKKKISGQGGIGPGELMDGAKAMPADYAALLCGMAQTLGDMDQPFGTFDAELPQIGVFMSDSGLYQRTFPDSVSSSARGVDGLNEQFLDLLARQLKGEDTAKESRILMEEIGADEALFHDYIASGPMPQFFGMTMPLLKAGIPLRPVQLENIARYPDYLSDYKTLILSYEYMKPAAPEYNLALAEWVKNGGTLIYVGDGSDPYHAVSSWWNSGKTADKTPASHLFRLLGLDSDPAEGVYAAGNGRIAVHKLAPARITLSKEAANDWYQYVCELAAPGFDARNYFLMQRGTYRIANVMTESVSDTPLVLKGHFVDMLRTDFAVCTEKVLKPGENALLCDLDTLKADTLRVLGTSARIFELAADDEGFAVEAKAAGRITAGMRLRLPKEPKRVSAVDECGEAVEITSEWNEESRSALLSFESKNRRIRVKGVF